MTKVCPAWTELYPQFLHPMSETLIERLREKRRKAFVLYAILALVLGGCDASPFDVAPVSGRVTLDGEPLANAKIAFSPMMQSDSPVVGPGSIGKTDEQGRYTLETFHGDTGAVVGSHAVQMSTIEFGEVDEDTERAEVIRPNLVPDKYRATGALTYEVPFGGSSTADFNLTSEP